MSIKKIVWSLLAIAATAVLAHIAYDRTLNGNGDWVLLEVGARNLVHYQHQNIYGGNRWHLYVENVDLQIGPPAFWLIAVFEHLRFRTIYALFAFLMPALGLAAVGSATLAGQRIRASQSTFRLPIEIACGTAAVSVAAVWAYQANTSRHLDDVIALSFAAIAAMLVARARAWWLVGILLGTAAATKPWAIILTPTLLGLPRRDIARTTLITILVAAFWWAPFVIEAPATIQALGHFNVITHPGSVLHLIGFKGHVERWLRPVQFTVGIAVGVYVAWYRNWVAAPLAALTTRVLTDPFAYGYYGLGPLLFAYLVDIAGGGWRGLPVLTAYTAALEYVLPHTGVSSTWIAVGKLVWGVTVLAYILGSPTVAAIKNAARDEVPAAATAEG